MLKAVIASDSFKGCLTSAQVADAVAQGILTVFPDCETVRLSVADGGEGTMDSLIRIYGGRTVELEVSDPLGRPLRASYSILADGVTAVIEAASASGLTLLSPDERNPMKTSSYGTGQMISDALDRGCRRFMVGIGGSATNDAGTGMLEALGYRFLDAEGNVLPGRGESLGRIGSVVTDRCHPALADSDFVVACDVDAPLYGPDGAAFVFAPQKGAGPDMVRMLDDGLRHFSEVIEATAGRIVASVPGAGAAGGLGAAFKAFMDAELKSGADIVLDALGFDEIISGADLVVTGEGKIDGQTLTGKLPYAVALRAVRKGIPVMAVCGIAEVLSLPCFDSICPVTPPGMPLQTAMSPDVASANIRDSVIAYMKEPRP